MILHLSNDSNDANDQRWVNGGYQTLARLLKSLELVTQREFRNAHKFCLQSGLETITNAHIMLTDQMAEQDGGQALHVMNFP